MLGELGSHGSRCLSATAQLWPRTWSGKKGLQPQARKPALGPRHAIELSPLLAERPSGSNGRSYVADYFLRRSPKWSPNPLRGRVGYSAVSNSASALRISFARADRGSNLMAR